jgi:hypothetical protein
MIRGVMGMSFRKVLAALFGGALLCGCGLNGSPGSALSTLEATRMGPPAITGPTIEQYMAYEQGSQKVSQGKMTLDGRSVSCGARQTVIDAKLDSWGGSYPGYLILNPGRLRGLATPVKFYVYYHECGHQFVGASETGADCYSIRSGVKAGWLNDRGMDQICAFISQLKGDAVHPPGPQRCQLMRQCYATALHGKVQARN